MIELYHNALSTCSQKVRMALAELGLDFSSHPVDLVKGEQHTAAFTAISPRHVVPILVVNGRVVRESSIINEYLHDTAEGGALIPLDPFEKAQMRLWVKRVDEEIHGHTSGVFTHAIWTHRIVGAQSADNIETYLMALPDPRERELRRSLIVNGADAPEFIPALRRMRTFLDDLNSTLASNQWLLGDQFSLADVGVLPYVVRVETTGLAALWTQGQRPHLARWLADLKARPSFTAAYTDWVPEPLAAGLAHLVQQSAEGVSRAITAVESTPRT